MMLNCQAVSSLNRPMVQAREIRRYLWKRRLSLQLIKNQKVLKQSKINQLLLQVNLVEYPTAIYPRISLRSLAEDASYVSTQNGSGNVLRLSHQPGLIIKSINHLIQYSNRIFAFPINILNRLYCIWGFGVLGFCGF